MVKKLKCIDKNFEADVIAWLDWLLSSVLFSKGRMKALNDLRELFLVLVSLQKENSEACCFRDVIQDAKEAKINVGTINCKGLVIGLHASLTHEF